MQQFPEVSGDYPEEYGALRGNALNRCCDTVKSREPPWKKEREEKRYRMPLKGDRGGEILYELVLYVCEPPHLFVYFSTDYIRR